MAKWTDEVNKTQMHPRWSGPYTRSRLDRLHAAKQPDPLR